MIDQLSQRERQVLEAYARGGNSRTIGERLFLSNETVRTHASAVRRKLHATTIAQACAIWGAEEAERILRHLEES